MEISKENIMPETKFNLTPELFDLLGNYKLYGFNDMSAMVKAALMRFKEELELRNIRESAELYTEVYKESSELHELTEAAVQGWPE